MPPYSEGSSLSDKDNLFEFDNFTFHVGGYETIDGKHHNVDAGDPLPSDLSYVDYLSLEIDPEITQGRLWIHVNGPFDDWDHVADAVTYWQENGS